MAESVASSSQRIDPHDADLSAIAGEHVRSARADFFGDAKRVAPEDWSKAAVGLVTLVVLGLIIITQVA